VPPRGKIQENGLRYVLRLTWVPDDFQRHAQDLRTRGSAKSAGRRARTAKRQKASVGLAWLIGMGDDGGGDETPGGRARPCRFLFKPEARC
jgi:hypothetical protein